MAKDSIRTPRDNKILKPEGLFYPSGNTQACAVYVIDADTNYTGPGMPVWGVDLCKIGVSKTPSRRYKQIVSGCPFPIYIYRSYFFRSSEVAFYIEREFFFGRNGEKHDEIYGWGEWRYMSSKRACEIIEAIANRLDEIYMVKER